MDSFIGIRMVHLTQELGVLKLFGTRHSENLLEQLSDKIDFRSEVVEAVGKLDSVSHTTN